RYLTALLSDASGGDGEPARSMHDASKAFVIGESHCLSAHGLVTQHAGSAQRWTARWIPGCKQWHLASPAPNKYKFHFERVVSELPQAPTLLLTFGEIDCRLDEGILRA